MAPLTNIRILIELVCSQERTKHPHLKGISEFWYRIVILKLQFKLDQVPHSQHETN